MFDLYHRFLDDFTHILLNPLRIGRSTLEDLPFVPIAPGNLAASAHLMPVVVQLDSMPRQRKLRLIDDALAWREDFNGVYFSACLVCPDTTGEHLAVQLARNLVVSSSPATRFLLRFDDQNVFTQLLRILDAAQLDMLMASVAEWHWEDPLGMVRTRLRGDSPMARIFLQPEQFAPLHRVGPVNACLKSLKREGNLPVDDAMAIGQRLDDALVVASDRGLRDDDRLLYATQYVSMGVPPESDPILKELLARVSSGEFSYVRACAEIENRPQVLEPSRAD